MERADNTDDSLYTVWRLIASHCLFPQSLKSFALVSKTHWRILNEALERPLFWENLRRDAIRFATEQFDDQEKINFETLEKSPIAQLFYTRQQRPSGQINCIDCASAELKLTGPPVAPRLDSPSIRSAKRSSHFRQDIGELNGANADADIDSRLVSNEELATRHFLRLCYFPVLWKHEYKKVVLFMNIPQKFGESEEGLAERMRRLVLQTGRLSLPQLSFHSSARNLIWSVEAGRKKRALSKRYWVPTTLSKETKTKLPWFKYQTVIAVCDCEGDADQLMARKTRFRKEARIYLTRVASSGDLDRILRKGNEHMPTDEVKQDSDL